MTDSDTTQSKIDRPLVVAFVGDMFFSIKIGDVARYLGYRTQFIEQASDVTDDDIDAAERIEADPATRQLAEHVYGPGSELLDQLTRWQPALLIFDLSNRSIPWRRWLPLIKSVPATRRIPVICFGQHTDVDTLQEAKDCGAELVVARSRFMSAMPALIEKHAYVPDYAAIQSACGQPLSALAAKGLEEFNAGRYFESHEMLEDAWNADQSEGRELYRAILQIAVAYLQIERGNYRGAVKMFLRARQWVERLPEVCRGVDVAQLRADAQAVNEALVAHGPDGLPDFDHSLMRAVRYTLFEAGNGAE